MSKLIRDPKKVLEQLVENKNGEIICKVNCKIQVPERFSTIGLGQIGINTFTYGCLAIILESGEYAVMNMNALVELNPTRLVIVKIDGINYHQFEFDAFQTVIKTKTIVKRDAIIYNVFDEFIFKGKVPWYVDYDTLGKLFDTAAEYSGSDVSKNEDVIEFLASLISHYKNDRDSLLRNKITSYSDTSGDKITYIPLSSVFYSVNSTMNKLAGSYFNDGVISALVNPSDKVEKLEQIIRM